MSNLHYIILLLYAMALFQIISGLIIVWRLDEIYNHVKDLHK